MWPSWHWTSDSRLRALAMLIPACDGEILVSWRRAAESRQRASI